MHCLVIKQQQKLRNQSHSIPAAMARTVLTSLLCFRWGFGRSDFSTFSYSVSFQKSGADWETFLVTAVQKAKCIQILMKKQCNSILTLCVVLCSLMFLKLVEYICICAVSCYDFSFRNLTGNLNEMHDERR
jgi:hypothetical protein